MKYIIIVCILFVLYFFWFCNVLIRWRKMGSMWRCSGSVDTEASLRLIGCSDMRLHPLPETLREAFWPSKRYTYKSNAYCNLLRLSATFPMFKWGCWSSSIVFTGFCLLLPFLSYLVCNFLILLKLALFDSFLNIQVNYSSAKILLCAFHYIDVDRTGIYKIQVKVAKI